MIAISLQSGSNGNCIYIESEGVKLLFDAGISSIQAEKRLRLFNRDIRDVNALIISHDHADHVRHAGVYQRRFGLPLFITSKTLDYAVRRHRLGRLGEVSFFNPGETLYIGSLAVMTIPSPHDGVDGSLFVVSSREKRIGIWTDLGYVFSDLYSIVPSLDGIFIESNHDPLMLKESRYAERLKERIRGPEGHLSNIESAELLQAGSRLKWACLSHLSINSNDPGTALNTHRSILGPDLPLLTASRYEPTDLLSV